MASDLGADDVLLELERAGLLTADQRERARRAAGASAESIDQVLIQQGLLAEREVLKFMARFYGYAYLEKLGHLRVPRDYVAKVPIAFARKYQLVSIGKDGGIHKVATCRPLDLHAIDDLAARLGAEVEPVLAAAAEIGALINATYAAEGGAASVLDELGLDAVTGASASEDLLDVANKAPIIRLVNNLLLRALKMRASDIHLHPFEDKLQVRFRVDGVLYDIEELPKPVQDAVITRVKVLGKMDIAERRLPQDGRASYTLGDGEVDLRISSVPTAHGERIVFRLLDKGAREFTLDKIGIDDKTLTRFRAYVNAPNGIILVTGPTGSGKTTTLYSALSELDTRAKNVITIEDPIEYHLRGGSQVQASTKKGLTFAAGLRSFLRQDPDVMMVGEIRDPETARIAIQAAQTGHLVFSTLHTNDSAGAVTRMLDIGVEPYLVSSSVICVMAQRLVRLVCTHCRTRYVPADPELLELKIDRASLDGGTLAKGAGCEKCMGTGYWDRTGIYELMSVSEEIKSLVAKRASANVIKQQAIREKMRTLRKDGVAKVLKGLTTIGEVLAVTMVD